MSIDPLRQKSVSEITAELFAPTVHKKFCSTLFGRLGALKGLRAQAQVRTATFEAFLLLVLTMDSVASGRACWTRPYAPRRRMPC